MEILDWLREFWWTVFLVIALICGGSATRWDTIGGITTRKTSAGALVAAVFFTAIGLLGAYLTYFR